MGKQWVAAVALAAGGALLGGTLYALLGVLGTHFAPELLPPFLQQFLPIGLATGLVSGGVAGVLRAAGRAEAGVRIGGLFFLLAFFCGACASVVWEFWSPYYPHP